MTSFQMGFRTLAIQERSSEVWRTLGAVKTEFGKFGAVLDGVQKKLQEASNKIEETGKRTRVLTRKLRDVEALPNSETQQLLGLALDDEPDDDA
jgi:DNA recombination protein RmuC